MSDEVQYPESVPARCPVIGGPFDGGEFLTAPSAKNGMVFWPKTKNSNKPKYVFRNMTWVFDSWE